MCDSHSSPKPPGWSPDLDQLQKQLDRRRFLTRTAMGLGSIALGSLMGNTLLGKSISKIATEDASLSLEQEILQAIPHLVPKAKRVVYLFMSGGPSQFETFDYKPKLLDMFGQPLPDSVRQGQRLTGMSAGQAILPVVPSIYKFNQYGKSNTWVSELLPHTAQVVDELCIIKSMYSEAINHDPAITFFKQATNYQADLQ